MYANVAFPVIDLQFLDYAVLAILLAVLYLASTLELLAAASSKTSLPHANELDLQKAASWSIAGIALTLAAGLVAGSNHPAAAMGSQAMASPVIAAPSAASVSTAATVPLRDVLEEYGGLLVPIFVLTKWLTFHLRGSGVVRIDLLAQELSGIYKRELLRQLGERQTMRATKDELFLACSKQHVVTRIVSGLGGTFAIPGLLVRMAPADITDKLTFTYARMEALIAELEKEGKVVVDPATNKVALVGAPPPQLPPSSPSEV